MSNFEVKVPVEFWQTLKPFKAIYSHEQMVKLINTIKDCIVELEEYGVVAENGWNDHVLENSPFDDGKHHEFHTFDSCSDDVLVVYFKLTKERRIRMVGVYDHRSIPGSTSKDSILIPILRIT